MNKNVDDSLYRNITLCKISNSNDPIIYNRNSASHLFTYAINKYKMFTYIVVIPTIIFFIYLFFIAADKYVSEAQFVVRSASSSGLENTQALIESRGLSRAHDELYVVNEYIRSRDALSELVRSLNLKAVYSSKKGDFINRFPNFYSMNTNESFFKYYKGMVQTYVDGSSGISTLSVVAFTPKDAQNIANSLIKSAENLINNLNARALKDAVQYAQTIVDHDRKEVSKIESQISNYREKVGLIDPLSENNAALITITRLSTELARIEALIEEQRASTPNNPVTIALQQKASSYQGEILRLKDKLAGGDSSIAKKMGPYDEILLQLKIAEKSLASAETNFQQVRNSEEQQHLYLQILSEPNLPDQASYPKRYIYLFFFFVASNIIFTILKSIKRIAEEHAI